MNTFKNKYIFILGTNPALSIAEILSVLKKKREFEIIAFSEEVLYIQCNQIESSLIDRLGGTIKIIKVIDNIKRECYDSDITINSISKIIKKNFDSSERKIHFGISIYDLGGPKKMLFRLNKSLKYLYINLKKICKQKGIKLAFLNIKDRQLSSASVLKNELTGPEGLEISLVVNGGDILVGRTISVQDIDKYSHMDVGRPVRDTLSGTTPPKLAKIMINLSEKPSNDLMLDPFCGSGTYLQEMYLLGYRNIIGTDISEKAVKDTRMNLKWLLDQSNDEKTKIEVYKSDVKDISNHVKNNSVSAVVSEVYLGPPLRDYLAEEKLNNLMNELTELYASALKELSKIVKDGGVIVLALPIFKTKKGNKLLPLLDGIKESGLKIENSLGDREDKLNKYFTNRHTIIYSRPDQLVLREIIVLKKG